MEPALSHGDELLFARIPVSVGSVAVARDPRDADRWIVKRVAAVAGRMVTLASDAADHETVSVDRSAIVGRAILRYRPLSKTAVVRGRAARGTPGSGCC